MNTLIVLSCVAIAVLGVPIHIEEPRYELNQHSNVDGSYTFSYSSEDSSKTESRQPNGRITGAYSYIDTDGILQKVQYVGDDIYGFQVYGTNLPVGSTVPVKETPEVLEATAQHFALVDEHLKKVQLAERLAEEYKAAHPEVKSLHVPSTNFANIRVANIPKAVAHTQKTIVHAPKTPVTVVHTPASKTVIHFEAVKPGTFEHQPTVVHQLQQELPKISHHETADHRTVSHKTVSHVEHHQKLDEIPVAPEEPKEIQLARAAHLAEHDRITAEHLAAVDALL